MPAPYRLPAPATADPADPTPAVVVWAPAMADPTDLAPAMSPTMTCCPCLQEGGCASDCHADMRSGSLGVAGCFFFQIHSSMWLCNLRIPLTSLLFAF
ncbi:hypothetical protein SORBI_3001G261496 [Sorghum bicolor]|uniref:Uncharacterized protein n=1 Tax=Sorghum bicolor TaxID=4558 RepID=A0A109NDM8_SORBI|nr:hypothetical protein SORBI_3001G261496 [Sorghum bicolor]